MSGVRIPLYVIGIDPGLKGHGYAALDALTGDLVVAGFVKRPGNVRRGARAWSEIAKGVLRDLGVFKADLVAVEQPVCYPHSPVPPNDLIEVACAGTYVGAALVAASRSPCTFHAVQPRTWKGQVPKEVMCKRIMGKLTDAEIQRIDWPSSKTYHSDVIDAIGIAKWAVSPDRW